MTESLYPTIGLWIGGVVAVWGWTPVAYFLILKAKEFIEDGRSLSWEEGPPRHRTAERFWVFDDHIGSHVLAVGISFPIFAALLWPIALLAGLVMAALLFLRLASRVKRHADDKNAHGRKDGAE